MKFADWSARSMITVGGIGTILAVCGVFVFLLWVVKDLFLSADVGEAQRVAADVAGDQPVMVGSDEYRTTGWTLSLDGRLREIRLDDGSLLSDERILGGDDSPAPTAFSAVPEGKDLAVGFADGSLRKLRIDFSTRFFEVEDVPAELRSLKPGEISTFDGSLAERTVRGQFRVQSLEVELSEPVEFPGGAPILDLHRATRGDDLLVAVLNAEGRVSLRRETRETDFMTGEDRFEWGEPIEVEVDNSRGRPRFVRVTDLGRQLFVCWADGSAVRYSLSTLSRPEAVESLNLLQGGLSQGGLSQSGRELTALGLLLGGSTLISGDDRGHVTGWFVVQDGGAVGGLRTIPGHQFEVGEGAAIRSIGNSARERMFVVGSDDGAVHVFFMTSEKQLAALRTKGSGPVRAVAIAPKDDALLAADSDGLVHWDFDPRHPETTVRSLFGKVWYERYAQPEYVWQSSSGTDDFEAKLSLIPLIFGTIKATFYSMLLAVPLALLAAIYTSEFLDRRLRSRIKPLIELMASLPSVVLGFLAAMVIAPVVEQVVPVVLAALFTVPIALLCGAFIWQTIPLHKSLLIERWRLPLNLVALLCGVAAAVGLGSAMESLLFAGDVMAWLDGQVGSGASGWFIMLLPFSAVAVWLFVARKVNPWMRGATVEMNRGAEGLAHGLKFVSACLLTIAVAGIAGMLIYELPTWFGGEAWDLRGGVVIDRVDISPIGTFDPRNALVVGFIMGFAVIPIIYTIAEDALSSVPEHLRAASLGAGATTWQTAFRVIIPTAMSGLFSACMVGLGRAVGETMIVLMAAGNTPILSMNTFNGFRTLSANIATELPEAVRDSTHYRTLFLAALVLFGMTFVINTVAESVRQRFRKRAYQL